jgi:hypothetical protein
MQATGQTCTHWGSSKWPTHSVHLWGVNFVNFFAHVNSVVGALGFANVTVDAFIGNDQSHGETFKTLFALWPAYAPIPQGQQTAQRPL